MVSRSNLSACFSSGERRAAKILRYNTRGLFYTDGKRKSTKGGANQRADDVFGMLQRVSYHRGDHMGVV